MIWLDGLSIFRLCIPLRLCFLLIKRHLIFSSYSIYSLSITKSIGLSLFYWNKILPCFINFTSLNLIHLVQVFYYCNKGAHKKVYGLGSFTLFYKNFYIIDLLSYYLINWIYLCHASYLFFFISLKWWKMK